MNQDLMRAAQAKSNIADVTGLSNPNIPGILFLVSFVVTLGWMGDTAFALIGSLLQIKDSAAYQFALALLAFCLVISVGWLRWRIAQHKHMKLKIQADDVEPHAGMVLFLSSINNKKCIECLKAYDWTVLNTERFSWKICQRGMEAHKSRLNTVWVICSPESGEQYAWFEGMFHELYPNIAFIRCDVRSFEDISGITDALEGIFSDLPQNIDESDVVIDVTSGQKPASIAGMMVSLVNTNRQVQYVQTNAPFSVNTYTYQIKTMGKGIVTQ